MRKASPSRTSKLPNFAWQSRIAFARMVSNTGSNSPGELEMTCSTSEVAVCCSRASASSRVRALTCSCRSPRVELAGRAAVGALFRLGFLLLPCCVFADLRLIVRRRLAEPSLGRPITLPHHEVPCAPQQNLPLIGRFGSQPVPLHDLGYVSFHQLRTYRFAAPWAATRR